MEVKREHSSGAAARESRENDGEVWIDRGPGSTRYRPIEVQDDQSEVDARTSLLPSLAAVWTEYRRIVRPASLTHKVFLLMGLKQVAEIVSCLGQCILPAGVAMALKLVLHIWLLLIWLSLTY